MKQKKSKKNNMATKRKKGMGEKSERSLINKNQLTKKDGEGKRGKKENENRKEQKIM